MRHAIGLSAAHNNPSWPTEQKNRIVFRSDFEISDGYFSVLAPAFNEFAQRSCQCNITFINVLFTLKDADLDGALKILDNLKFNIVSRPRFWREHLGTYHEPGKPVKLLEPRLSRSRALAIVNLLNKMVLEAKASNKVVVYGNGAAYRAVCGIKLPPGAEAYS